MKHQEEKASLCALGRIFGFEPKTAIALIEMSGSARNVFNLDREELDKILGPFSRHKSMITMEAVEKAAAELEELEGKGISYCGWNEDTYPALLKECPDPPVGLYVRSDSPLRDLWKPERKIAVIGTRDLSSYGREWCEKCVMAFSECPEKPLVISGLALGTDICAHRTALAEGIPTIGVMATGPESIYPYRNTSTALQMVHTPGCALITDYPPGTAPLAVHFLRRNRIIAGLAEATILIESKHRGGGMMTSRLAFSYDRDVYALPGRIDDIRSQGCNELIRAKIAEPLTSVKVLLESLGLKSRRNRHTYIPDEVIAAVYGDNHSPDKTAAMTAVLKAVKRQRDISIEELSNETGLAFHEAANLCSIMEADGLISIDLLQRCSINTKNF